MSCTAEAILTKLDAIAKDGNWPTFDGVLGVFEYHAMRMVAVRERGGDDDWGLAFECVFGDFLDPGADNPAAANVSTYVITPGEPFGVRAQRELELAFESEPDYADRFAADLSGLALRGPAGVLHCDRETVARLDLHPGMLCGGCDGGAADWRAVLAIRAYLAAHPGAFWRDVTPLFGPDAPCDVIVTSEAFAHVVGRRYAGEEVGPEVRAVAIAPSESPTFRSLAEALATRDPSRFVAGASNLDWRQWASVRDDNARLRT